MACSWNQTKNKQLKPIRAYNLKKKYRVEKKQRAHQIIILEEEKNHKIFIYKKRNKKIQLLVLK